MKRELFCKNGIVVREMIDGVEVTENLHKTLTDIGIKRPVITSKPIQPIIFKEWPIWAKALKHFSKPEDKGIGDVVARMIGNEKSEAFKAWHHATFGKPCNCASRQARWNRIYPLP